MGGGNKKPHCQTQPDGWRAKLSKRHGQSEQAGQVRRGGSKRHRTNKQNKRGKNLVQCSTVVGFFQVVVFGVLFNVSSHRKDRYPPEKSNLSVRTSLRTTLIEVDVTV